MTFIPVFSSVVLVVRNQSGQLEAVLSDPAKRISPLVSDYELIIVDNASDDQSVSLLVDTQRRPTQAVFRLGWERINRVNFSCIWPRCALNPTPCSWTDNPMPRERSNNFDSLRLIAALLVIFSHQFALSGRWEPRFVGDHSFGNLGVLCFFSISGYLVSASWSRDPNAARFLIRRFLRIAPGLIVSMTLTYGLVFSLDLVGFPGNPIPLFNGSLWTIPLEVSCYILLLGALVFFRGAAVLAFLACLFALWVAEGRSTSTLFYLAYFGLFFGFGALLREYGPLRTWQALVLFCATGFGLILANHTILGLAFLVPPLAITVGSSSWPLLRAVGRYGDFSYGLYIYAWPIQQLIVHWLGQKTDYFKLLIPSLLVTFVLAFISWHLVERPALTFKPKVSK